MSTTHILGFLFFSGRIPTNQVDVVAAVIFGIVMLSIVFGVAIFVLSLVQAFRRKCFENYFSKFFVPKTANASSTQPTAAPDATTNDAPPPVPSST